MDPTITIEDVKKSYHANAIKAVAGAIELLKQPGRWTQGVNARTEEGGRAPPSSKEAFCFCLNGTIMRNIAGQPEDGANFQHTHDVVWKALEKAGYIDPIGFNDQPGRQPEEVVAVLEKTLALLKTDEAA